MNFKNERIIKILKIIFFILIAYLAIAFLAPYFAPFIFGYILSIVLTPLYKFFKNLKFPRFLNAILCISIFIIIISFIGVGIVWQIINQAQSFSENIPTYIEQVKSAFEMVQLKISQILEEVPFKLEEVVNNMILNIILFFTEFLGSSLTTTSFNFIKKIPNILMIIVLGIISCFLIFLDKENIDKFIIRQIPRKYYKTINIIKNNILKSLSGYIKAQSIIMIIIGSICFIGLTLFRFQYSLLLAFIIAIIDALPILGSGFILWPWAIYHLIVGNYSTAICLFILYLIVLITRQILEPKILSQQIGINPLVTLMSMYVGLKAIGAIGIILGPLVVVMIKALQNENILPKWK